MSVTIGHLTFDHVAYDAAGDVLYLHVGAPRVDELVDETPEGHVVRVDASGAVVGVTIVNAKWLLDQGMPVALTLPERVDVDRAELASALHAA